MAKVELKQPVVQAIAEDVKDATSVVLVDYRGLTVAEDTEMRKQLREAGVVYKVCKNTMMKRAFEGTDFAALDEHLEGPSAIAISKDDATAPARILCKFAKNAKALELKAGVVEGTLYDVDALNELAKSFFPNYLEAYSHLSQTWLAFSIRSQKKVEQMLVKQLRQQKKLQRHQQLNRLMAA